MKIKPDFMRKTFSILITFSLTMNPGIGFGADPFAQSTTTSPAPTIPAGTQTNTNNTTQNAPAQSTDNLGVKTTLSTAQAKNPADIKFTLADNAASDGQNRVVITGLLPEQYGVSNGVTQKISLYFNAKGPAGSSVMNNNIFTFDFRTNKAYITTAGIMGNMPVTREMKLSDKSYIQINPDRSYLISLDRNDFNIAHNPGGGIQYTGKMEVLTYINSNPLQPFSYAQDVYFDFSKKYQNETSGTTLYNSLQPPQTSIMTYSIAGSSSAKLYKKTMDAGMLYAKNLQGSKIFAVLTPVKTMTNGYGDINASLRFEMKQVAGTYYDYEQVIDGLTPGENYLVTYEALDSQGNIQPISDIGHIEYLQTQPHVYDLKITPAQGSVKIDISLPNQQAGKNVYLKFNNQTILMTLTNPSKKTYSITLGNNQAQQGVYYQFSILANGVPAHTDPVTGFYYSITGDLAAGASFQMPPAGWNHFPAQPSVQTNGTTAVFLVPGYNAANLPVNGKMFIDVKSKGITVLSVPVDEMGKVILPGLSAGITYEFLAVIRNVVVNEKKAIIAVSTASTFTVPANPQAKPATIALDNASVKATRVSATEFEYEVKLKGATPAAQVQVIIRQLGATTKEVPVMLSLISTDGNGVSTYRAKAVPPGSIFYFKANNYLEQPVYSVMTNIYKGQPLIVSPKLSITNVVVSPDNKTYNSLGVNMKITGTVPEIVKEGNPEVKLIIASASDTAFANPIMTRVLTPADQAKLIFNGSYGPGASFTFDIKDFPYGDFIYKIETKNTLDSGTVFQTLAVTPAASIKNIAPATVIPITFSVSQQSVTFKATQAPATEKIIVNYKLKNTGPWTSVTMNAPDASKVSSLTLSNLPAGDYDWLITRGTVTILATGSFLIQPPPPVVQTPSANQTVPALAVTVQTPAVADSGQYISVISNASNLPANGGLRAYYRIAGTNTWTLVNSAAMVKNGLGDFEVSIQKSKFPQSGTYEFMIEAVNNLGLKIAASNIKTMAINLPATVAPAVTPSTPAPAPSPTPAPAPTTPVSVTFPSTPTQPIKPPVAPVAQPVITTPPKPAPVVSTGKLMVVTNRLFLQVEMLNFDSSIYQITATYTVNGQTVSMPLQAASGKPGTFVGFSVPAAVFSRTGNASVILTVAKIAAPIPATLQKTIPVTYTSGSGTTNF